LLGKENVLADGFSRLEHGPMRDSTAERCSETDHGGYVFWSLSGDRARQNATETVTDEMKLAASIVQGLLDARIEALLDQDIRTFRVDADARGSAVVLVPGFLGTDAYLTQLHTWLGRIGYRPSELPARNIRAMHVTAGYRRRIAPLSKLKR
jgi:hypothetical protein